MNHPSTQLPFLRLIPLLLAFVFSDVGFAAPSDAGKERLQALEKELEQLRENLHEAQRELAAKEERIEALEKELIAAKGDSKPSEAAEKRKKKENRPAKKMAPKKPEEKKPEPKKTAAPASEEKKPEVKKPEAAKPEAKKPEVKKPEAKKPEVKKPEEKKPEEKKPAVEAPGKSPEKAAPAKTAAAPKPAARLHTIAYGKNSAASYEGREAALAWVREQLKRDPKLAVKITGTANDSQYADVNKTIAENRARYLADYFVISGLPREAITSVEGTVSKSQGDAGRSALVLLVERPGTAKN